MAEILIAFFIIMIITIKVIQANNDKKYRELEAEVLKDLNYPNWNIVSYLDESVIVKSRATLEKYDAIKFFKENREKLAEAEKIIQWKNEVSNTLTSFLENNPYKSHSQYKDLVPQINTVIGNAEDYRICVDYISSAGNNLGRKWIVLNQYDIDEFINNPSLLMGKGEYNKFLKEQQKEALEQKQHEFYESVNEIIDYANTNRDTLVIKDSQEQLDALIARLFDRTVNSIKKIKTTDSEEWDMIGDFIFETMKKSLT